MIEMWEMITYVQSGCFIERYICCVPILAYASRHIFTDNLPNMLINIQLMTFHEVNTRIDQAMEHDIHRGRLGRCEYHVPWVDQSLYSPKLKVINCFII
jgi:hypothetical protein